MLALLPWNLFVLAVGASSICDRQECESAVMLLQTNFRKVPQQHTHRRVEEKHEVGNLARSHLLTDAVETHGARCLDGSPQRIWVQESKSASRANRSKWYFHFMGGGWCTSHNSCAKRAYHVDTCYRGSSSIDCFNNAWMSDPWDKAGKSFNETMDFRDIPKVGARWGGGLLMNTPTTNPLTHDWNKVLISYCDGGSYSGNQESVTFVEKLPLYYRGFRNLEATVDYLSRHFGLNGATHLVVSGDSAGGLASIWHADYFQEKLPRASVIAVSDSGFFIHDSSPEWPRRLTWIATAMNSTSGLDESCVVAAKASGESPADACMLPEKVAPHVSVPLFVLNSRFDPTLIDVTTKMNNTSVDVNAFGERFIQTVKGAVLNNSLTRNAVFITSCAAHCGQWSQGQDDFNVTIEGLSAPFAVQSWAAWNWGLLDPGRSLLIQSASYPCKTCCHGGSE